jgi:hypothetical protein
LEGTPSRRGKMPEFPPWLMPSYFLDDSEPDIRVLRRADGSFVAAFSARGATREGIIQAAQEDYRQRHRLEPQQQHLLPMPAPQEGAGSLVGKEEGWEEFIETERRALEARRSGQLRRDLGDMLPGESPEYIERLGREDRRRAQEGLVEIMKEGEPLYKHIDELTPEDRPGRICGPGHCSATVIDASRRDGLIGAITVAGNHNGRSQERPCNSGTFEIDTALVPRDLLAAPRCALSYKPYVSEWPEVACRARDLFLDEGADLALPGGFCGPKPPKNPLQFFWPRTGKTSTQKRVMADGTPLGAACKGEIVALWPFAGGFSSRLSRGIDVRVCDFV